MTRHEILIQMQDMLRDILDEDTIELSESTTAPDVEGWDSLNNIQFIVAIEHHFDIKFDSDEMISWKNVGEMVSSIEEKLA